MSWTPLATRLSKLPLVLAGPILRQVNPNAVTVWLALQRPAEVTLTVFETGHEADPNPMQGKRKTVAVGKNLHIVAVTARSQRKLLPGKTYCYDLNFLDQGPLTTSLGEAIVPPNNTPAASPFAYSGHNFPSFSLPPKDLNALRLVHGSCRKPHGGGPVAPDALAILDSMIASTADSPINRPHQLILTGDQIYADEVEEGLLAALTDAGDTLLGWSESLPGVAADGPYLAAQLLPSTRTPLMISAGLTSIDTRSHLISLGEYLAMYLFVWSDVLWTDLPTFAEIKSKLPSGVTMPAGIESDMKAREPAMKLFRSTLPDVRRVLANVPTYMMFDDHEVTDDWNMTLGFLDNVYGNPLGIRIIQNGLVAYSICQAWGNVPEQFQDDAQVPAGLKLLKSLGSVTAAPNSAQKYQSETPELMKIVGVHKREDMDAVGSSVRVFHDILTTNVVRINGVKVSTVSLRYHFSVEGPSHQIIVTDTRTWRWFIAKSPKPSMLADQFYDQFRGDVPDLSGRLLIIVFSTNAPCIATIRMLGRIALPKSWINEYDMFDSWELPSREFDEMIVEVTNKLPVVNEVHTGSVVFLSGDIHFSFASRLAYWAEIQRLGDKAGQRRKAKLVVGQLVSSALKNEQEKTRGTQIHGYTYMPPSIENGLKKLAVAPGGLPIAAYLHYSGIAPPHAPEAYAGWNIPVGGKARKVGNLKAGWIQSGETLKASGRAPTLTTNLNYFSGVKIDKPDYRYRIDFLSTAVIGQTAPPPPGALSVTSVSPTQAAKSYSRAAAAYRDIIKKGASPPDCIGYNTIGEISFVWEPDPNQPGTIRNKRLRHTLRWRQPKEALPFWATYDVSLNVDDASFPPIKASVER